MFYDLRALYSKSVPISSPKKDSKEYCETLKTCLNTKNTKMIINGMLNALIAK